MIRTTALLAATLAVMVAAVLLTPPRGACAQAGADVSPRLEVHLEPTEVTVGDRVTAVLTVTGAGDASSARPRFPTWEGSWGDAEVVEVEPVERLEGGTGWRQRLVLVAFRTGVVALPRRAIELPHSGGPDLELVTGDDLSFTVASVLPDEVDPAAAEPAPAAPLQELPVGAPFWWTFGAGLALLVGALALLAARRPPEAPETAPVDPLAELHDRLARIGPDAPPDAGHVALSAALRTYLGRRLDFPAAESTTTEIRRRLRERHLPEEVAAPAGEVLTACDRVKFARERPESGALGARVEATHRLAERLEDSLRTAWERTRARSGEDAA